MAALAKDRNTPARAGGLVAAKLAAGAKVYAGSMVARKAAGYAAAASTAVNLVALGRAEAFADNTGGSDGDVEVLVRTGPESFRWENLDADKVTAGDIGAKCYIADDQTVARTSNSNARSEAGIVTGLDSKGVWVRPTTG